MALLNYRPNLPQKQSGASEQNRTAARQQRLHSNYYTTAKAYQKAQLKNSIDYDRWNHIKDLLGIGTAVCIVGLFIFYVWTIFNNIAVWQLGDVFGSQPTMRIVVVPVFMLMVIGLIYLIAKNKDRHFKSLADKFGNVKDAAITEIYQQLTQLMQLETQHHIRLEITYDMLSAPVSFITGRTAVCWANINTTTNQVEFTYNQAAQSRLAVAQRFALFIDSDGHLTIPAEPNLNLYFRQLLATQHLNASQIQYDTRTQTIKFVASSDNQTHRLQLMHGDVLMDEEIDAR